MKYFDSYKPSNICIIYRRVIMFGMGLVEWNTKYFPPVPRVSFPLPSQTKPSKDSKLQKQQLSQLSPVGAEAWWTWVSEWNEPCCRDPSLRSDPFMFGVSVRAYSMAKAMGQTYRDRWDMSRVFTLLICQRAGGLPASAGLLIPLRAGGPTFCFHMTWQELQTRRQV